jgi:hypothetical protein
VKSRPFKIVVSKHDPETEKKRKSKSSSGRNTSYCRKNTWKKKSKRPNKKKREKLHVDGYMPTCPMNTCSHTFADQSINRSIDRSQWRICTIGTEHPPQRERRAVGQDCGLFGIVILYLSIYLSFYLCIYIYIYDVENRPIYFPCEQ